MEKEHRLGKIFDTKNSGITVVRDLIPFFNLKETVVKGGQEKKPEHYTLKPNQLYLEPTFATNFEETTIYLCPAICFSFNYFLKDRKSVALAAAAAGQENLWFQDHQFHASREFLLIHKSA